MTGSGYLPAPFADAGFVGSWYGEATVPAIGFLTAVFGFFASRLLRFCPLAIVEFLCGSIRNPGPFFRAK